MKKPPSVETTTAVSIVLCVAPDTADNDSIEHILHESGWQQCTVLARHTLRSALSVLEAMPVPIIICDADRPPDKWRELLDGISKLPDPPLLILTSRLADERLWAEALNIGAYDVLAKPLQAAEVVRILSLAWQHWVDRYGIHHARTRQRRTGTA